MIIMLTQVQDGMGEQMCFDFNKDVLKNKLMNMLPAFLVLEFAII